VEVIMPVVPAILVLSLLAIPSPLAALQGQPQPAAAAATQPAAAEGDVASPEAIVAALYDVISGPAGQARNWDRFKSLFAPGARLVPAAPRQDGSAPPSLSPDDYVQRTSAAFLKNGFFEREVARRTESFGTVVHVFSTYDSRRAREDEKPFARGINSIQLMKHAGRWWIVTVIWDQERPDNPIPQRYLANEPPR
jgi:hypothetical protein